MNLAIVGKEFGPNPHSWTERDVMFYALSVGASAEDATRELNFTTQNTQGVRLQALPTFPVLMSAGPGTMENLGTFELHQVLHAEQSVRIHTDLPTSGTVHVYNVVTAIEDKGHAAVVRMANRVETTDGTPLAVHEQAIFVRGEGGFGGERGASAGWARPDREPDGEASFTTRPEQALLYRLNGDSNPLHSDPASAHRSGFERPILHGLCTYGIAGRLLTREIFDGDAGRVGAINARFSSPVLPGETVTVRYWRTGDGALYQALVDDRVVLDHGTVNTRS